MGTEDRFPYAADAMGCTSNAAIGLDCSTVTLPTLLVEWKQGGSFLVELSSATASAAPPPRLRLKCTEKVGAQLACETHGFSTKEACLAVGCCSFEANKCVSAKSPPTAPCFDTTATSTTTTTTAATAILTTSPKISISTSTVSANNANHQTPDVTTVGVPAAGVSTVSNRVPVVQVPATETTSTAMSPEVIIANADEQVSDIKDNTDGGHAATYTTIDIDASSSDQSKQQSSTAASTATVAGAVAGVLLLACGAVLAVAKKQSLLCYSPSRVSEDVLRFSTSSTAASAGQVSYTNPDYVDYDGTSTKEANRRYAGDLDASARDDGRTVANPAYMSVAVDNLVQQDDDGSNSIFGI